MRCPECGEHPGSHPYCPVCRHLWHQLIEEVCRAEELFGLDELEEHALLARPLPVEPDHGGADELPF